MKKNWNLYLFLLVVGIGVCFTSCGSDEKETVPPAQTETNNNTPTQRIPSGWYESGDVESTAIRAMEDMISFGESNEDIMHRDFEHYFSMTAIHVKNAATLEYVVGRASLYPSYYYDYASKSFSNGLTLYFSYLYVSATATYDLQTGKTYNITKKDGVEKKDVGFDISYSNGTITLSSTLGTVKDTHTYKKINFSPQKTWPREDY